jgi:hypothetical protein
MSSFDPDRAGWWFLQTAVMRTAHQDVLAVIRRDMEELWARGIPYQAPEWWLIDNATPAAAPLHKREHPHVLKRGLQVNVWAVECRFRDHLYEGKLGCCGRNGSSLAHYTIAPPWTVANVESWWAGGGILRLESGDLLYNARVKPPGTAIDAQEVQPTRDPRGAKRKYDWDAAHREIIRLANTPDGLPERAEIKRHIEAWFGSQDVYPGKTAIDEFVSKIFRDLAR